MADRLTRRQGKGALSHGASSPMMPEDPNEETSDDEGSTSTRDDSKLSRYFGAPLREKMARSCCSSTSLKRPRNYCGSSFQCLYVASRLWQSRYSYAHSNNSLPTTITNANHPTHRQVSFHSTETSQTDEETPLSDVVVPQSPKLMDYSKCRALLIPEDISSKMDVTFTDEYNKSLDDDDDDVPGFPESLHCLEKVQFSLRVPKTRRQFQFTRSPVGRTLSAKLSPQNNKSKPRLTALPIHRRSRRRSNSSDDDTPTTAAAGIIPPRGPFSFPIPMSRENSTDNLLALNHGFVASPAPRISHRQRTLLSRTAGQNSPRLRPGQSPRMPTPELPVLNKPEETIIALNDSSRKDEDHSSKAARQTHSDDELAVDKHRKRRMQRRSSFVAGSKIERFDGGRRSGNNNNNPESYTEWKIDLMVNG